MQTIAVLSNGPRTGRAASIRRVPQCQMRKEGMRTTSAGCRWSRPAKNPPRDAAGENRQPDFEEYTRATAAAFAADEQRNVLPSRRIAAQLVRQKAQPVSLLSSRTHKVGLRRLKHLRRRTFVTPLRKPKQRSRAWGGRLLEIASSVFPRFRRRKALGLNFFQPRTGVFFLQGFSTWPTQATTKKKEKGKSFHHTIAGTRARARVHGASSVFP